MSRWLSKLEGVLNEVDQTGAKLLHAERDEPGGDMTVSDEDPHRVNSDAADGDLDEFLQSKLHPKAETSSANVQRDIAQVPAAVTPRAYACRRFLH